MTSSADFEKFMKRIYEAELESKETKCYDRPLYRDVRFESASLGPPTRVSYLFTVRPEHCNKNGVLHGGCATTLIDVLTTSILFGIRRPDFWILPGVSRSLNITFLRPVPVGKEARITCELIHAGRRLAMIRAEIQRTDTGEVCVTGEHDKANIDPRL